MELNYDTYHIPVKKINTVKISTLLITLVLLLQVFRRLNTTIYIVVLLVAYMFWIFSLSSCNIHKFKSKSIIIYSIFFCFFVPLYSVVKMSYEDLSIAIIRYGAIIPYFLISILYIDVIKDYSKDILKLYCMVIFASAVLMVFQVFFGKIEFFTDATERLGYERYGSLLGSTTTYGTISIIGILIIYTYKPFSFFKNRIIEGLIIIGGILCLSKSFFVNVALGYLLIFVFRNKTKKLSIRRVFSILFLILFALAILYMILRNTIVGKYFYDMYNYAFNNEYNGTKSDLLDRLTTLPASAFKYYGESWYMYIIGGQGFSGYSGVLGLPDYPMCHNNYFETILVGGFIYFLLYMYIYMKSFMSTYKKKDTTSIFVKRLIPYWLINMLIGAGSIISTPGLIVFMIIVSYLEFGGKNGKNICLYSNLV